MNEKIKLKWEQMPPEKKRVAMIGGIGVLVVALAFAFDSSEPRAPSTKVAQAEEDKQRSSLVKARVRDNSGDALAAQLEGMRRQMGTVQKEMTEVRKGQVDSEDANTRLRESAAQVDNMKQEVDFLRSELALLKSGIGDGREMKLPELRMPSDGRIDGPSMPELPMDTGRLDVVEEAPVKRGPTLRVVSGSGGRSGSSGPGQDNALADGMRDAAGMTGSDVARAAGKGGVAAGKEVMGVGGVTGVSPETFIPAGSILEGVLINGMDAPTSGVARRNPVPGLVRIKADAILPNGFKHNVKECFVIVAGQGLLATERVEMRTETLSCIRDDNGVIEAKMEGYVTGEDGKVGLRGRLVTKAGAVIGRSLIAAVVGGLSSALTPERVPSVNVSGGGAIQTQRPNVNDTFEAGALQGAQKAADRIADFYMKLADDMYPVLEIDAARKVNIILVRGMSLSFGVQP